MSGVNTIYVCLCANNEDTGIVREILTFTVRIFALKTFLRDLEQLIVETSSF